MNKKNAFRNGTKRLGTERNLLGTEGFAFWGTVRFLASFKIINIITLFKQLCFHIENNDRHLGMLTVLKSVTFVVC